MFLDIPIGYYSYYIEMLRSCFKIRNQSFVCCVNRCRFKIVALTIHHTKRVEAEGHPFNMSQMSAILQLTHSMYLI